MRDGLLKIGLSPLVDFLSSTSRTQNCSLFKYSLWIGNDQARALESPEKVEMVKTNTQQSGESTKVINEAG